MGEKKEKRGEKRKRHLLIEPSLRGTPFIRLCRFDSILFLLVPPRSLSLFPIAFHSLVPLPPEGNLVR